MEACGGSHCQIIVYSRHIIAQCTLDSGQAANEQETATYFILKILVDVVWIGLCKTIVSVLGREEGYTVKYNPLPAGVPESEA